MDTNGPGDSKLPPRLFNPIGRVSDSGNGAQQSSHFAFNLPSTPQQSGVFGITGGNFALNPTSTPAFGQSFNLSSTGGGFGTNPMFGGTGSSFGGFGTGGSSSNAATGGFGSGSTSFTPASSTSVFSTGQTFGMQQQSTPMFGTPTGGGFGGMSGGGMFGNPNSKSTFGGSSNAPTGFMSQTGSGFGTQPQSTAPFSIPISGPAANLNFNFMSGSEYRRQGSPVRQATWNGITGGASQPSGFFNTSQATTTPATGFQMPSQNIFRPANSGGFGFVTTTAATTTPASTPQATGFNALSGGGFASGSFPSVVTPPSDAGVTSQAATTSPPAASSAPSLFNPVASGVFQWGNQSPVPSTGIVASGSFTAFNPRMAPPSVISPAVSLAAATPVPNVPASEPPPSGSGTPSTQRRQSEIQPDTTTDSTPQTSAPVSSPPATSPPNQFSFSTAPTSASPVVSSEITIGTSMAPQSALPATVGLPADLTGGRNIGAVLHEAIPTAHQMEDDFNFIAGRMAQRDLAIVKGGQEISELAEQYQKLMAAQGYFEEEMQRFESQLKHTQQHAKTIIDRLKEENFNGTGVPLKAALDQVYDGLVNSDTFFTEMEEIMETVFAEKAAQIQSQTTPNTPSQLEVESLMLEMREIDNRRKILTDMLDKL